MDETNQELVTKNIPGVKRETVFCSKNNFLFSYSWPQDFSEFIFKSPKWLPLVQRLVLFLYFGSFLLYDITVMGEYTFIFLTYWDFILYNLSMMIGFLVALDHWLFENYHSRLQKNQWQNNLPILYKIYWVIYTPTYSIALVIASSYWSLLYPRLVDQTIDISNLNVHLFTPILVLVDQLISARPWRWHHIWLCYVFSLLYAAFTGVHYAAGWTNGNAECCRNQTYIYSIINYRESPGFSSIVCMGLAIFGPLLTHSILYGIFRIRSVLWTKCNNYDE